MRENRPYGSEGGVAKAIPTPIPILQRWGWQPLEVDCEEQWRPPGA